MYYIYSLLYDISMQDVSITFVLNTMERWYKHTNLKNSVFVKIFVKISHIPFQTFEINLILKTPVEEISPYNNKEKKWLFRFDCDGLNMCSSGISSWSPCEGYLEHKYPLHKFIFYLNIQANAIHLKRFTWIFSSFL